LTRFGEEKPFDRLNRNALGKLVVEMLGREKFEHRAMVEANAAITRESEQRAL
jgi:hypothetical protein